MGSTTPERDPLPRYYDEELLRVRAQLAEIDPLDLPTHRQATSDSFAAFARTSDELVEISEMNIPVEGTATRVRVYTPRAEPRGGLLWLHGGAFVLGAPEMDDDICLHFAARHRLLVVSPDYRLAPEHPFPVAEKDCRAALSWLIQRLAASWPRIGRNVVVAGASAGGALALRTALHAATEDWPVERLVLAYPVVDSLLGTESMRRYVSSPIFDAAQAQLMWRRYLTEDDRATWPSPLRDPNLARLPLTLVITAEHDPLRDEGLDLVRELLSAGVSVQAMHVAGTYHAYDRFAPDSVLAHQFRQAIDEFLRRPRLVVGDW